jgi:hypothetical protein
LLLLLLALVVAAAAAAAQTSNYVAVATERQHLPKIPCRNLKPVVLPHNSTKSFKLTPALPLVFAFG